MLETLLLGADNVDGEISRQQDAATAHRTSELVNCLTAMFPGSIVIGFGDIVWPVRPPDLRAPD
jgi:hypothetical protein